MCKHSQNYTLFPSLFPSLAQATQLTSESSGVSIYFKGPLLIVFIFVGKDMLEQVCTYCQRARVSSKLCPIDVKLFFSWNSPDFSAPQLQEYTLTKLPMNWTPPLCSPDHFKVAWLKHVFGKWTVVHGGLFASGPWSEVRTHWIFARKYIAVAPMVVTYLSVSLSRSSFLTFRFLTWCRSTKAEDQVKPMQKKKQPKKPGRVSHANLHSWFQFQKHNLVQS